MGKVSSKDIRCLDLGTLERGRRGITPAYGASLAEAAAVCLEDQGHAPGVTMMTSGLRSRNFALKWKPTSQAAHRTWADEEFTTEQGAYAVATLLVEETLGWEVVERSRKGTGFDYWLGTPDPQQILSFKNSARLEVSGIRRGNISRIDGRVRIKQRQIQKSAGRLPGVVVVVEFGSPRSRIEVK